MNTTEHRWMVKTFDGRIIFLMATSKSEADKAITAKGYSAMMIRIAAR